jgi:hypothetical protein
MSLIVNASAIHSQGTEGPVTMKSRARRLSIRCRPFECAKASNEFALFVQAAELRQLESNYIAIGDVSIRKLSSECQIRILLLGQISPEREFKVPTHLLPEQNMSSLSLYLLVASDSPPGG